MASVTDAATLFDLGNRLFEQGETDAAIATLRRCLAFVPSHAGVLYNLGNALRVAGRSVEAVEVFVSCLQNAPAFGAAYVNLAETLRQLALLTQALEMAELGVRYMPEEPAATICLANVLHDSGSYAPAAALYRQALYRSPTHAGALSSLGNTLRAMGELPEALAMHERALAACPDVADFHFNRAAALLTAGDFAAGWEEYEWRWRQPKNRPRALGEPWRGETVAGRTILLHAEQGLGDTLQFVRYAPLLAERGARVVLEVQPPLVRLVRRMPGIKQVVARGDVLPPFDIHCPLLSLPRIFATRLDTIPARIPYLHADPADVAAWDRRLPAGDLRVGVVWAGSPHTDDAGSHLIDQRRSLGLQELDPLADVAGIHWVSLQKDRAPNGSPSRLELIDLMPDVTDFADTAAIVATLDLVISVDTSVAHLAGAMGRPVWLLSRYDGCWRWLHGRHDSPWYPAMRIYQQEQPLDWSGVIGRIRSDLADRRLGAGPASQCRPTVS